MQNFMRLVTLGLATAVMHANSASLAMVETDLTYLEAADRNGQVEKRVLFEVTADSGNIKLHVPPQRVELAEGGWSNHVLKIELPQYQGCVLRISSAQIEPVLFRSNKFSQPASGVNAEMLAQRFLELVLYKADKAHEVLITEATQYEIIQLYTVASEPQKASFFMQLMNCPHSASTNQATVTFGIRAATQVHLDIKDQLGRPTSVSLTITDGIERLPAGVDAATLPEPYRYRYARRPHWERVWGGDRYRTAATKQERPLGIYPFPAQRTARHSPYADLYFQAQIYRYDGDSVLLQPGVYELQYTQGPETIPAKQTIVVGNQRHQVLELRPKRWINMRGNGWYSGDLHVHATGCKHTTVPDFGVEPTTILRQAHGEGLDFVSILNWGIGWEEDHHHLTNADLRTLKSNGVTAHRDVEISEFPSGDMGHIGLYDLSQTAYPGTRKPSEWPASTLPILQWARQAGATTSYLHPGWGMQPVKATNALPNFEMPQMNGIGANEYAMALTRQLVDLYGAGATPIQQELNLWYQSLNAGFRPRLLGESDWPCIFHERIGISRVYAQLEVSSFESFIAALKRGQAYVSDGRAHIVDFAVNGSLLGAEEEIHLQTGAPVTVTARVAAHLAEQADELEKFISTSAANRQPHWSTARARLPGTRNVQVQLVHNAQVVGEQVIVADGTWRPVTFQHTPESSGWYALRIYPAAHTNPIFVIRAGKPILIIDSVRWLKSVTQRLWQLRAEGLAEDARRHFQQAYREAIHYYDSMLSEAQAVTP